MLSARYGISGHTVGHSRRSRIRDPVTTDGAAWTVQELEELYSSTLTLRILISWMPTLSGGIRKEMVPVIEEVNEHRTVLSCLEVTRRLMACSR